MELIKVLNFLRHYDGLDIDEANREVIAKVVASQPVIIDNVRAKEVIPEPNKMCIRDRHIRKLVGYILFRMTKVMIDGVRHAGQDHTQICGRSKRVLK